MIGKNTKALRDEVLKDTSSTCCFSVVAKIATLDLSSPDKNPIQVREFTAYLKGLQRHFISQASQFMQQTPNNRHQHAKSNGHYPKSSNGHHHSTNNQHQKPLLNTQQNGKMKLSPIGTGFGGFKFDDKTGSAMSATDTDNDKP